MKKNNFQIILVSIFGFFIILGITSFSLYKAKDSSAGIVEVTIWGTVDSGQFDNFINKIKFDLGKEVRAKYVQKNLLTVDLELIEAIASGVGPDMVLLPQSLILRYYDKVYPIPYKSLPERVFKDTFVQEGELLLTSNGIIGLPFFIDPLVMYWNRNILTDAGIPMPPKTWSEFPILAEKMSKIDSNSNITQSAVALGGYRNINNAKEILSSMLLQAGSSIIKNEGGVFKSYLGLRSDIDTEIKEVPAYTVMRFYTDYSNPQKSVYSWNNSLQNSKQMFLSGDLAIYFGKASEFSDLRIKNPNLNFDVAFLPQVLNFKNENTLESKATFGDMYSFMILKSSKNITSAFSAAFTLAGADTTPIFLGFNNFAPARKDVIKAGVLDPAKSIFYDSAIFSRGWFDPIGQATDVIFQNMVENITTGRDGLESAVQKANQELNNLL